MSEAPILKPTVWVGSSRKDLCDFPEPEVIRDFRGDTFLAVYTVRFAGLVYVLHAFQKKSKTGRETPRRDMELIQQRLREAERIAEERER